MYLFNKKKKKTILIPKQTIGITRSKTFMFNKIRNPKNDKLSIEKARIRCRFDKLLEMYKSKSYFKLCLFQTDYEKEIVYWNETDKSCKYCFNKKSHNCRICGEPICKKCTKEIPLKDFDSNLLSGLILCKGLCFTEILDYKNL